MHSRRDFLWLAAISLPTCAAFAAASDVRLGVQTYSFREMLGKPGDMTEKMIAAMRQLGITECEMWEPIQGDTPITAVLQVLKREHYPIPAFIEYEYPGTGTATEEVGKCLAYARDALA